MIDETNLLSFLFNFNTDHWVKVNLNDTEYAFKYRPLTIQEKLNITNKFELVENEKKREADIIIAQCKLMLKKAYDKEEFDVDALSNIILTQIYFKLLEDIHQRKKELEEFYDINKTPLITKPKSVKNKLDSIVSMCNVMKECNMTLGDLSALDEVSLFSLMVYVQEVGTRESNSFEANKKGK